VPPPPQGVASLRKSNRRRITKKKSNEDSDEDPPPPALLKSPPEPLVTMPLRAHGDDCDDYATMPPRAHGGDYDEYATMPPRAHGDDYDDYATMPPRAHGDDYDDYNEFGKDDGSPVVKSNPNGLLYSSDDDDDDDDTFKFDADLEDFTLKDYADSNKEAKLPGKRRLRYDDGPQPRDYSKMTPTERLIAEAEDTKKRRVWLAKQRRERMLNESAHVVNFTGIVHASLRTMHDVEQGTRLQLGQTFPSSNIIMLCCAEEANLRGIYVTTLKSDKFTFKSEGLHFRVHALSEYGKPYVMTENIIQKARIKARKEIFGDAKVNVKYTEHVQNALIAQGHHVKVTMTNRKETIAAVKRLVVAEELQRLKATKQSMSVNDRKTFAADWLRSNEDLMVSQLGSKTESLQFVHGIFFAPSFATATVPYLQRVFMADACHLNFGFSPRG
jgi:hypothetical protein